MRNRFDPKGAIVSMLLPDGELAPGYIARLMDDLEERRTNFAREQAGIAADDGTHGQEPSVVAATRFGALRELLAYTAKDAGPILWQRAFAGDERAATLWLVGADAGFWPGNTDEVDCVRELAGLAPEAPMEAKPMRAPETEQRCRGQAARQTKSRQPTQEEYAAAKAQLDEVFLVLRAGEKMQLAVCDPTADAATKFAAVRRWFALLEGSEVGRKILADAQPECRRMLKEKLI